MLTERQIRYARLRAARAKGRHSKKQWRALCAEFAHRCVRCGMSSAKLTKDHITPLYQEGSDGIDNIQPLCGPCNFSKGPESFNWAALRRQIGFVPLLQRAPDPKPTLTLVQRVRQRMACWKPDKFSANLAAR